MKVVLYTNMPSPHQLPLATEIAARVGEDCFRYVYTTPLDGERTGMGWARNDYPVWCVPESPETAAWLEDADVMLTGGIRPLDLLERRVARGLATFYMSERWFKPIPVCDGAARAVFRALWRCGVYRRFEFLLPGWIRLAVPSYRRMARRFAALFDAPSYRYLPTGPVAAADMRRLLRFFRRPSDVAFVPWGYFVAASSSSRSSRTRESAARGGTGGALRLLWVGRVITNKHVETIVCALARCPGCELTIVGDGPEKPHLRELAARLSCSVSFLPSMPIDRVREVMREHDVYVLSSNSFEGWGAVVSEALEEGMEVVGTSDAGASATLLPPERRFRCGDWRQLARIVGGLARERSRRGAFTRLCALPDDWTARGAADRLLRLASSLSSEVPS